MRWFLYTLALWLVPTGAWVWIFDNVRTGRLAPYVFGLLMECKYHDIRRVR